MSTSTPTPVMAGISPPPATLSRINIGDFLRRAAQRSPESIAIVDGDTRLSYSHPPLANALGARYVHVVP